MSKKLQMYNPLRSVDGIAVPLIPSSYQWSLQDISNEQAGRTEDTKMYKNRIGQDIKLSVSWEKVSIKEASVLLKMFNPEYIMLEYLDTMQGDFVKAEFYVGDRSAPLFNSKLALWENVSFNLIKRSGK